MDKITTEHLFTYLTSKGYTFTVRRYYVEVTESCIGYNDVKKWCKMQGVNHWFTDNSICIGGLTMPELMTWLLNKVEYAYNNGMLVIYGNELVNEPTMFINNHPKVLYDSWLKLRTYFRR